MSALGDLNGGVRQDGHKLPDKPRPLQLRPIKIEERFLAGGEGFSIELAVELLKRGPLTLAVA